MTRYNVQISAHAEEPAGRPTAKLPATSTLKFFVKAGEVLGWDESVEIYNLLAANDIAAVDKKVKHVIFPGATYVNYKLWGLGDDAYISGTLLAGSTVAIVDIADIAYENAVPLKDLIDETLARIGATAVDTVTFYFNACRA